MELFNRNKEVDFLLNLLKHETPQISLITGLIYSGKSLLMRHVLGQLAMKPTILSFNMQELPFVDVDTFIKGSCVTV